MPTNWHTLVALTVLEARKEEIATLDLFRDGPRFACHPVYHLLRRFEDNNPDLTFVLREYDGEGTLTITKK